MMSERARLQDIAERIVAGRFIVPLILVIQFGFHLMGYFNTMTFSGISESGVLLGKLDAILSGQRPQPLYGFYWYFTPAYIASWFIRVFGSLDSYFVFQCLMATIASFLIYLSVVKISGSRKSGVVSLVLATGYTEYILLSSVFYNQVYENFLVLMTLLMILNFARAEAKKDFVIYGILILVTVMVSLMFRNTLVVSFVLLLIIGVYFLAKKKYTTATGFMVLSLVLFLLIFIIKPLDFLREGEYRPPQTLDFWGHTLYGGNGGEVGFIYSENEDLFNKRLEDYARQNNIREVTPQVVEEFKGREVKRFITREPHRWLLLQAKKVLYTFGVMPQRDGLTMLMTGRVKLNWVTSAILLQVPFLLIMVLFIMTVDVNAKRISGLPGYRFILYLLGLYLVAAVSVYGAWAERYRIVVMAAFIIPVTAINIGRLKTLFSRDGRKELMIRLSFVLLLIMIWGWQAYEALVIHRERYMDALDRIAH